MMCPLDDLHEYKGPTPVKEGQIILVKYGTKDWTEAVVQQPLASQFTARVEEGYTLFFLYKDRGVTWAIKE